MQILVGGRQSFYLKPAAVSYQQEEQEQLQPLIN